MMTAEALRRDIGAAMAALGDLNALLDEERVLIERRQPEALEALAGEKMRLLGELEQHNPATRAGPSMAAVEAQVTALADPGLSGLWEDFTAALRSLRRANERNGIVIHSGLQTLVAELDILHGGTPQERTAVYDAGGRHRRGGAGRLSTRA